MEQMMATIVGALATGVMALIAYILQQHHVRRDHVPAMDGSAVLHAVPLDSSTKSLVCLHCVWNNRGKHGVQMVGAGSCIQIFRLDSSCDVNMLEPFCHLGDSVCRLSPWDGVDRWGNARSPLYFEPGTHTESQTHFLLEQGFVYMIRVLIQVEPERFPLFGCRRDLICDLRNGAGASSHPPQPMSTTMVAS